MPYLYHCLNKNQTKDTKKNYIVYKACTGIPLCAHSAHSITFKQPLFLCYISLTLLPVFILFIGLISLFYFYFLAECDGSEFLLFRRQFA